jgi:hypothetical protein
MCSGCASVHDSPIHSLGSITVEDLPTAGKRGFLHVPIRKVPCFEDGRIWVEELNRIRGSFTKRLAEPIFRLTSATMIVQSDPIWPIVLDPAFQDLKAHHHTKPSLCHAKTISYYFIDRHTFFIDIGTTLW